MRDWEKRQILQSRQGVHCSSKQPASPLPGDQNPEKDSLKFKQKCLKNQKLPFGRTQRAIGDVCYPGASWHFRQPFGGILVDNFIKIWLNSAIQGEDNLISKAISFSQSTFKKAEMV